MDDGVLITGTIFDVCIAISRPLALYPKGLSRFSGLINLGLVYKLQGVEIEWCTSLFDPESSQIAYFVKVGGFCGQPQNDEVL